MRILLFSLFVVSALTAVLSCKGPAGDVGPQGLAGIAGTTGPAGPTGQNHKGDLSGFVKVLSELDATINPIGVTVVAENTNPLAQAITDQTGKFVIKDLPIGNYVLRYKKDGHDDYRVFNIRHVGGGNTPNYLPVRNPGLELRSRSLTRFINPKAELAFSNFVRVSATMQSPDPVSSTNSSRGAALFASTSPDVSKDNFEQAYAGSISQVQFDPRTYSYDLKSGLFTLGISTAGRFKSGQTVYFRLYGASCGCTDLLFGGRGYTDPETGKFVYSELNAQPTEVFSLKLP